jgi:heat-inducible transcriptional repressor
LHRIDVVPLAANRVMAVLTVRGGHVRTIALELPEDIAEKDLIAAEHLLNERLSGLTLAEIRDTVAERLRDVPADYAGAVRLFLNASDRMFEEGSDPAEMHLAGAKEIMTQPEFATTESVRTIVELLENRQIIVHVLDAPDQLAPGEISVKIGEETGDKRLAEYSLVSTHYRIGSATGTVGVIGPKRMDYARMFALVGGVARLLSTGSSDR